MNIRILFYRLREYLFPSGCASCGEALLNSIEVFYGICAACRRFFEAALKGERRCKVCGKPLITEKESCLLCRDKDGKNKHQYNEKIVRMWSLFPYTGKFKNLLRAYKFRKFTLAGNFFTCCLVFALEEIKKELAQEGVFSGASWVPVPPRPGKIKKQGWDQIEFLAKKLGKNRGFSGEKIFSLPVNRCLKRLPSRSQKELNREERGSNLKGRIICAKTPPKNAVLFDDVITTGSTLNACAQALLEGGAKKVYGICLFFD